VIRDEGERELVTARGGGSMTEKEEREGRETVEVSRSQCLDCCADSGLCAKQH
jgi:hypothetical protein